MTFRNPFRRNFISGLCFSSMLLCHVDFADPLRIFLTYFLFFISVHDQKIAADLSFVLPPVLGEFAKDRATVSIQRRENRKLQKPY